MEHDPLTADRAYSAALPRVHRWARQATEDDLAGLPSTPAIYLLLDEAGAPIQLATTQQLRRLLQSRLLRNTPERAARADLTEIARGVRWREVHSAFEGRWRYFLLARQLHPRTYRKLISFGPAWFLSVNWDHAVPQIRATDRICEIDGESVGPWRRRSECIDALEGLWDLFELCRYPPEVAKSPGGKRCAYADMGRCDAPCDGSAPLDPYLARTRAAWEFVCGGAHPWIERAQARIRESADRQDYERAAQLTRQAKFAQRWLRDWSPHVLRGAELNFLLAIPVTRRKKWKLFLFRRGELLDGPTVSDKALADDAIRWVENAPPVGRGTDRRLLTEQTWLVAHFLRHKEARTAIIEPLPAIGLPIDIRQFLVDSVADRRARTSHPPAGRTSNSVADAQDRAGEVSAEPPR